MLLQRCLRCSPQQKPVWGVMGCEEPAVHAVVFGGSGSSWTIADRLLRLDAAASEVSKPFLQRLCTICDKKAKTLHLFSLLSQGFVSAAQSVSMK